MVRYRARPQICNHCPAKPECTDSDEGGEVVRPMDPWPHSEAGRFHRGISLAVDLVAALILAAELVRNHAPAELAVLTAALVVVALAAWHLHAAFRDSPRTSRSPTARRPSRPRQNRPVSVTGRARRRGAEGGDSEVSTCRAPEGWDERARSILVAKAVRNLLSDARETGGYHGTAATEISGR